jgi:site-specific DNA-methyltransferase (adenine-specific)
MPKVRKEIKRVENAQHHPDTKLEIEKVDEIPRENRYLFWTSSDKESVKLYHGHVVDVLKSMPSRSVHMCGTSPPYWGLRDYKTNSHHEIGSEPLLDCDTKGQAQCGKCFVCVMVAVFREVKRVLRHDGTLWLNLGDSWNSNHGKGFHTHEYIGGVNKKRRMIAKHAIQLGESGLHHGSLCGAPWRVALALQADGWVLRQDIIWHKPSPIPESIRNRCTKAHEYIFLFAQGTDYYYDAEAIKTEATPSTRVVTGKIGSLGQAIASGRKPSGNGKPGSVIETGIRANRRSVWTVSWQGYNGAHFATFPPKLIEPCILAGTSEHGCCKKCGAPFKRIVEETKLTRECLNEYVKRVGEKGTGNSCANSVAGVESRTIGWEPTCYHEDIEVIPCTVLDPFIGSGTSVCVSLEHGRRGIGIDLNEQYLQHQAITRIEGTMLAVPALNGLLPKREIKTTMLGKGKRLK